ncbi:MAG: PspC domain-containing protein [Acidimicrobiia bacterium]
MKQVKTIHIAKIPYYIEDEAYSILENYINRIGLKFDDEIAQELTNDVELRIVELLEQRNVKRSDVIDSETMAGVLDQIGELSDEVSTEEDIATSPEEKLQKRKLYRDSKRGMISGVCVGLSKYFEISESIFRLMFLSPIFAYIFGFIFAGLLAKSEILFLAFMFSLFTVGIYVVLVIILPDAKTVFDQAQMKGVVPSLDEAANLRELSVDVGLTKREMQIQNLFKFFINLLKVSIKTCAWMMIFGAAGLMGLSLVGFIFSIFITRSQQLEIIPFTLHAFDRVIVSTGFLLFILWLASFIAFTYSLLKRNSKLQSKVLISIVILLFLSTALAPISIFRGIDISDRIAKSNNKTYSYEYDSSKSETLEISYDGDVQIQIDESSDGKVHVESTTTSRLSRKERVRFDKNKSKLTASYPIEKQTCSTCQKYNDVRVSIPMDVKTLILSNEDSVRSSNGLIGGIQLYSSASSDRKVVINADISVGLYEAAYIDNSYSSNSEINLNIDLSGSYDPMVAGNIFASVATFSNLNNFSITVNDVESQCIDCGFDKPPLNIPSKAGQLTINSKTDLLGKYCLDPVDVNSANASGQPENVNYQVTYNSKALSQDELSSAICTLAQPSNSGQNS